MKKVNVNELIKYINENFYSDEVSVDDFKDGSGVYGIEVGSRGYIEDIFKVEDFKLRSKEELIKEMLEYYDNDKDKEEFLYYEEEFIGSGEIDWNEFGGVYEGLGEESSIEYYNVEL